MRILLAFPRELKWLRAHLNECDIDGVDAEMIATLGIRGFVRHIEEAMNRPRPIYPVETLKLIISTM